MLLVKCLELDGRPVTLLDGDIVRKHLASERGFSKEHRDLNIRRIGFVYVALHHDGCAGETESFLSINFILTGY